MKRSIGRISAKMGKKECDLNFHVLIATYFRVKIYLLFLGHRTANVEHAGRQGRRKWRLILGREKGSSGEVCVEFDVIDAKGGGQRSGSGASAARRAS